MEASPAHPGDEINRLQRCVNDLVSVLALPAIWTGREPSQVVSTLLDALLGMLGLNFIYARLNDPFGGEPLEMVRGDLKAGPREIGEVVKHWLGDEPNNWPPLARNCIGDQEMSLVPLRLGLDGEIGAVVAGSARVDFPQQTERLVLSVAANQAAIGLQEARLRSEQKRVASELDLRVAQRTKELAEANEELHLQVGLLKNLPVSAWTLKPDGTPDLVNQVWLEFSGQTLDFVRSHPEAWMTAVHPEDREAASRAFWEGVRSGQGFAVETRSLRARDGAYRWHLNQAVALRDAEGKVLKFVGTTTDIHDQKLAEAAVRASEANLRRVIDTIPTLSWCNLPDGPNEFLSRGWHEYTGLSPEEAHGWGWAAAFHPDDLPPLMKRWQELLVSGEPGEIEARIRRHDGEYRWFLIRVAPFRDNAGKLVRWYGTSTDIDDRKLAEEALRASEAQLRQTVDSIPGLVCTMSPAGEIEHLNQQLLEYFGKTPEELRSWRLTDAVHPDDLPRVLNAFTHSMTTGAPYEIEHRCRRADGVYRWFQVRARAVRDVSDRITGWYVLLTDIDRRKQTEDELRRSEAFLAQGQRLNLTGTFAWSLDTDEVTFSRELYRIFEFDPDAAVTPGQIGIRVHPEDIPLLTEKAKLARREINDHDCELRLRMPDGRVKYLRAKSHGMRHEDGRLEHIGAIQDVTERRLAEDALSKVRSELAHMTRVASLGALTASITHEVNQPLSGIVTNASTCLRMLSANPPNVDGARETLRRTIRDGHRASDVVTRLRALFTKHDAATELVDLNDATREVIALSLSDLQRNQVIPRAELADDLPFVRGDRVQLQQVILNLLLNASDAMSSVVNRPRQLAIKSERDKGDCVRLSVQDTGVGIDPSHMDKLFEAFFTTKSAGMGMGLSVSRSIIESHHGRLWATPNDGPGATFSFSLPCKPDGASESQSAISAGR